MNFLVVEENPEQMGDICNYLESLGHDVVGFPGIIEAVGVLEGELLPEGYKPDGIFLCDQYSFGFHGANRHVLAQLMKHPAIRDAPKAFAAHDAMGDIPAGIPNLAYCLISPLSREDIDAAIKKLDIYPAWMQRPYIC